MISVLICTYNRADVLRKTLASFFAQEARNEVDHEVIVVDNNSTDATPETIRSFAESSSLRYVFEPRQGLSIARNRGVAESQGEFVALLDDDVIVDRHWLGNLFRCFLETDAAVVGGRSYLVFPAPPPDWLGPTFRKMLSEVELGPYRKPIPEAEGLFGLNLAFRKSALRAVDGFDERLGRQGGRLFGGEETAVLRRIAQRGETIVYDPNVIVGHMIPTDRVQWGYFRRYALDWGTSVVRMEETMKQSAHWQMLWRDARSFVRATAAYSRTLITSGAPYDKKRTLWSVLTSRSRLAARVAHVLTLRR